MYLTDKPVTRIDKTTNEETLVDIQEVLLFVGTGKKAREEALISLLQGSFVQDLKVCYYIKPLNEMRKFESNSFVRRTEN